MEQKTLVFNKREKPFFSLDVSILCLCLKNKHIATFHQTSSHNKIQELEFEGIKEAFFAICLQKKSLLTS